MAKEYIEREAMIQRFKNTPLFPNFSTVGTFLRNGVIDLVEKQSAADVVEVKHGEWKMAVDEADYEYGTCSECGFREYNAFCTGRIPNYCSNCGAKMDGERKTEND